MRVLLLEPDFWRFLGISQILKTDPGITFLGDADYQRILDSRTAPPQPEPDVVIVSHSLTIDHENAVFAHLRKLFPRAEILVDGYDEALDSVADVLRAGAKGYFLLSSEPPKLLKALSIVQKGFIWAPREVIALLIAEQSGRTGCASGEILTPQETAVLKLLQRGLTNKEIAAALGLAEVTIKTHLTKLYRRFGVHTRLQLLTYSFDHHLLANRIREA